MTGFQLQPGAIPSTAPTPTLSTHETVSTDKPVLLYRDTTGWCPFCERVWLALEEKGVEYDTVLINLRSKPEWYKSMVPTALVPAAQINGELVYESKEILLKLEASFPERPLLPVDEAGRATAMELMDLADEFSKMGYEFLSGREMGAPRSNGNGAPAAPADAAKMQELRSAFEAAAMQLDSKLAEHGGPFWMGQEMGMVDIMFAPSLERLGANLPLFRDFSLRDHPQLPHLAAWYAAMNTRASYQKVKSDDATLNLVFKRIFGLAAPPALDADTLAARREAAAKIAANRENVVADILVNSGLVFSGPACGYGCTAPSFNGTAPAPTRATRNAVDYTLRRLCDYLLTGSAGPRHPDREAAAIGAASLAFFHNRASSPRDMTAAAATEMRAACMEVLKDMY